MSEFKIFDKKEDKEPFDFFEFFSENKTFIYSVIFYFAGLLCGSYIYKNCQNEVLNNILAMKNESFIQELINNLSVYFLIYALSVLFGLCLVGFPFINFIPMFIGFETSMKITYYYTCFGMKGMGYALLMIIPFVCFFTTIIMYSISMSYTISKNTYLIAVKKEEPDNEQNYKIYLKKYMIYAGIIFIAAVINTAVCTALSGIITI